MNRSVRLCGGAAWAAEGRLVARTSCRHAPEPSLRGQHERAIQEQPQQTMTCPLTPTAPLAVENSSQFSTESRSCSRLWTAHGWAGGGRGGGGKSKRQGMPRRAAERATNPAHPSPALPTNSPSRSRRPVLPGTCSQLTPGGPAAPVGSPPGKPGLLPPPPPLAQLPLAAAAGGSSGLGATAAGGAAPLRAALLPPLLPGSLPVGWPAVRPEAATTASRHAARSWARHMGQCRCRVRRSAVHAANLDRSECEPVRLHVRPTQQGRAGVRGARRSRVRKRAAHASPRRGPALGWGRSQRPPAAQKASAGAAWQAAALHARLERRSEWTTRVTPGSSSTRRHPQPPGPPLLTSAGWCGCHTWPVDRWPPQQLPVSLQS